MLPNNSVLVGGCFDVLHFGHLEFLKAAKQQGSRLVVALESDEFIRTVKHREPIHVQEERRAILEALRFVDKVVLMSKIPSVADYEELVRRESPSVIAVTEGDPQLENKRRMAALCGAKVVTVTPLIRQLSTTSILAGTGK